MRNEKVQKLTLTALAYQGKFILQDRKRIAEYTKSRLSVYQQNL